MAINAEKSIKDTINKRKLISKDTNVILGLSGGPDSMCLFYVLYKLQEELGIKLHVVHINHMFRPGYAEKDQKFVENLCEKYSIDCYSKTLDITKIAEQRGESPEEAGRNERYTAFDERALELESQGIPRNKIVIAVAQNKNDRIETVIMRVFRGTDIDGLSGIPYKRESEAGFAIVRPLLDTDRPSIEDYCEINDLKPRIDHTNSETNYNRNKIRLDLLPKLKSEYNESVEDAIFRLSELAATDRDYLETVTEEYITKNCEFVLDETDGSNRITAAKIPVEFVDNLHPAISRRVIISILKKIGLKKDMEATHIDSAIGIIKKNKTGKISEFPANYKMKISYGYAEFYNESDTLVQNGVNNKCISFKLAELKTEKEIVLPEGKLLLKIGGVPSKAHGKHVLAINLQEAKANEESLEVRYKNPGDRISLKGINGTKKLQDLFVDEKIPRDKRDRIPIILLGSDIIWAVGVRKSDKYTVLDDVKECLLLEWTANN